MGKDFMRFFLIGADRQTRIPFGAPGCPVRLASTPTGLQGAPFSHDFEEAVGLDGGIYRGTKDEKGVISLKVWVADPTSSAAARRAHAKWREALGRGKTTCRLFVVTKESGYWWIDVRLASVSEANHWGMPGEIGEVGETVNFVSDRSFWTRFEEHRTFDRLTAPTANITNVGDQPAYLKYIISGKHDGILLGVGDTPNPKYDAMFDEISGIGGFLGALLQMMKPGRDTHLLGPRTSDQPPIIIDTDPSWPTIMDADGNDLQSVYPTAYWDKPLPPRQWAANMQFPLIINPINPGPDFNVQVSYQPRTEAAW